MSVKEKVLRKVSIVIGLLLIIGGVVLSFNLTKSDHVEEVVEQIAPVKSVEVREIHNTTIRRSAKTTGTIKASKSIDVFAEVGGNLLTGEKPFKTGILYQEGEPLLRIDSREELLDLEYQKTDFFSILLSILPDIESDYPENLEGWTRYIENYDAKRPIKNLPEPKSKKAKYYLASKKIEYKYLGIKKAEFKLTKYTVYAPFTGILNTVNINPGALVRTGQKLGTFINTNNFELEISIPVTKANHLALGSNVNIFNDDESKKWKGKVARIGKSVDETTQTQSAYIAVSGKGLFQGMYLNAAVESKVVNNACAIHRTVLNKDNTVYIIDDDKIDLIQVTVMDYYDNMVIVQGIPDNTKLLNTRFNGIYKGMYVKTILK